MSEYHKALWTSDLYRNAAGTARRLALLDRVIGDYESSKRLLERARQHLQLARKWRLQAQEGD
jgi:hypothetical protein